jgi:hypothetical protein
MQLIQFGEQENAPELPIGRSLNSKSFGGNRVIWVVLTNRESMLGLEVYKEFDALL